MLYVVNDLHGSAKLINNAIKTISKMKPGDTLVVNGDGAGARGPIMNKLVKVFYEVRRGETAVSALLAEIEAIIGEKPEVPHEWIYNSVHAGVFRKLLANRYEKFDACMKKEATDVLQETLRPLSDATRSHHVELIYLPGNGEIVPDDFDVNDITVEKTVIPESRFYQRLAEDGYFMNRYRIDYVQYVKLLPDGVLLLSTHLLDMPDGIIASMLEAAKVFDVEISKVLVHYPPGISPVGGAFDFWTANRSDIQRCGKVEEILNKLHLSDDAMVYFGHIHLGADDARMDRYPSSMTFMTSDFGGCIWVKPGTVIRI